MHARNTGRRHVGKARLLMTPMIDVVFLLLIFFIMTFKIVAPEGDFQGRWFPLQWIDDNGKKGHITLESSPLAGMHQPAAFVAVEVK